MANYNPGPVILTGMVLASSPVSDYDRRVVILTRERERLLRLPKAPEDRGPDFLRQQTSSVSDLSKCLKDEAHIIL